jgi:hypothetical protein
VFKSFVNNDLNTKVNRCINYKIIYMKRILQKCIDAENKSGITFVEVMVIGVLVPLVVRNIKNYVINIDKHNDHNENIFTS